MRLHTSHPASQIVGEKVDVSTALTNLIGPCLQCQLATRTLYSVFSESHVELYCQRCEFWINECVLPDPTKFVCVRH
jgi:hypothetical protein